MGIDKYTYQSKWAQISMKYKLTLWLVGMVIAFSNRWYVQIIWMLVCPLLTLYAVPIKWKTYLKWLAFPLGIVCLSGIIMSLSIGHYSKEMMAYLPIGSWVIGIYKSQLILTKVTLLRSITSILATFLLAFTTPMKQILSFMTRCHIPKVVIELTMLMYRFIFIFVDDLVIIYQAQVMRNGYQNFRTSLNSAGQLAAMLFQKTFVDALALNEVLEIKGYTGEFPIE